MGMRSLFESHRGRLRWRRGRRLRGRRFRNRRSVIGSLSLGRRRVDGRSPLSSIASGGRQQRRGRLPHSERRAPTITIHPTAFRGVAWPSVLPSERRAPTTHPTASRGVAWRAVLPSERRAPAFHPTASRGVTWRAVLPRGAVLFSWYNIL
jgi:hypothetical protein